MLRIAQTLEAQLRSAMERAFPQAAEAALAAGEPLDPQLAPASKPEFGDFQANGALPLAKPLGQAPRAIAAALVEQLQGDAAFTALCLEPQIAGPGFINLTLRPERLAAQVQPVGQAEQAEQAQPPQAEPQPPQAPLPQAQEQQAAAMPVPARAQPAVTAAPAAQSPKQAAPSACAAAVASASASPCPPCCSSPRPWHPPPPQWAAPPAPTAAWRSRGRASAPSRTSAWMGWERRASPAWLGSHPEA